MLWVLAFPALTRNLSQPETQETAKGLSTSLTLPAQTRKWPLVLNEPIEHLYNIVLGFGPGGRPFDGIITALEDNELGDGIDAILGGDIGGIFGVELGDFHFAGKFVSDGVDGRCQRPARSAPNGPEIDENRDSGFDDFLLPVVAGKGDHVLVSHFCLSWYVFVSVVPELL